MTSPRAPRVLLGVTGCVGAFKAVLLLRLMRKAGWEVRTILTESGEGFVGEASFHALSGHPVARDTWDPQATEGGELHVDLSDWADAMVVYPATANTLGGLAAGLADDLLRLTALCFSGPILVCPAMHTRMHDNPVHRRVINELDAAGFHVLPSVEGELASGEIGRGRLPEPEVAMADLARLMGPHDLVGRSVLVSAGPTREHIDPVRFLSNPSTGRMGYALAAEAKRRGADVVLVSGPTSLIPPSGVRLVSVVSAADMAAAVHAEISDVDALIMSAAVADFRPASRAEHKTKKDAGGDAIHLVPTEDILGGLRNRGYEGILVGFAMETEQLLENARAKLKRKGLDLICANDLGVEGAGFGGSTNVVTLIGRDGAEEALPKMSKSDVAARILRRVAGFLTPT